MANTIASKRMEIVAFGYSTDTHTRSILNGSNNC